MVYLHLTGFPFGKYNKTYHLFADTEEELHVFAEGIGLKRGWFQPNRMLPHYDVFGSKYKNALENGAEIVNDRTTYNIMKRNKKLN